MADQGPAPDRPTTLWRAHLLAYSLLSIALIGVLFLRYFRPLVLREQIAVEPALVAQVEQRIDPNLATWAELSRLPGVGESLARRIVDHRDQRLALVTPGSPPIPVFASLEDLEKVKGVGPKLLERMAPGLKFPASSPASARSR